MEVGGRRRFFRGPCHFSLVRVIATGASVPWGPSGPLRQGLKGVPRLDEDFPPYNCGGMNAVPFVFLRRYAGAVVRIRPRSFLLMRSVARRKRDSAECPLLPAEDIYGHLGRVHWFCKHLSQSARIIEVGCGTGYQVTLPLRKWGYDIVGVDIDSRSIDYGRRLFESADVSPELLSAGDFRNASGDFDAVIISEVLEHLSDPEIDSLLKTAHTKLRAGGVLLVTVPNGHGWFEVESFLWKRLGIGALLTYSGVAYLLRRIKGLVVAGRPYTRIAPTLSSTPHVQRFTYLSICRRIERTGFDVYEATGSVLACGPFSDMLLTGAESVMQWNRRLGARFPTIAAGFYLAARKLEQSGAA